MAETLAFQDNLPSASHLVSTPYIFCVRTMFLPALMYRGVTKVVYNCSTSATEERRRLNMAVVRFLSKWEWDLCSVSCWSS